MNKRWTIYCHTHIESGRRYVGLTSKTMMARWNGHVNLAKRSNGRRSHFAAAIKKYGPQAFSHEVLEVCYDLEVANIAEECWIKLFDSRNPEKGFNLMKSGEHAPHPKTNPWERPEFREKMVHVLAKMNDRSHAARSAVSRKLLSDPEVKRKMSEATSRQFAASGSRAAQSELLKRLHSDLGTHSKFQRGLDVANANKRTRTHCARGHEFSDSNARVDKNGWRSCRICAHEAYRRRKGLVMNGEN